MKWSLYFKLMRFNKPVGIGLLWFPTAWALWIANNGESSWLLTLYFFLGSVVMRAAGCVVNDIADRNIDRHVKRTAMRPLTRGKVSLLEAFSILLILLIFALLILIQLPSQCFVYALLALFVSGLYPFCKRFFQAPQFILGIAFSMGIPMAFAASNYPLDGVFFLLFTINFLWIVAYDTMYAMVDRKDDLQIGVKSTAILFASFDWKIIMGLQITFHTLWLGLGWYLHYSLLFYLLWIVSGYILFYQQKLVNTQEERACFKAFLTSVWYGAIMWMGLIIGT